MESKNESIIDAVIREMKEETGFAESIGLRFGTDYRGNFHERLSAWRLGLPYLYTGLIACCILAHMGLFLFRGSLNWLLPFMPKGCKIKYIICRNNSAES